MMKLISSIVFGMFSILQLVAAEWIQPPVKTDSGYRVPQPDFIPQLPRDLGSHPGYGVEWWYWVGHLELVESGRKLSFQSTVFRLEGEVDTAHTKGQQTLLGNQQLFMAHLALSDLDTGDYSHAERVFREGWQAQASTETLDLQVGPIIAYWDAESRCIIKKLALPKGRILEIKLQPVKPLIVFGERGLSRKGSDPSAVSWYWTYPRLEISGVLIEGKRTSEVSGIAWMDHEVSSTQLSEDLQGWDWTAIQLFDGTEVKAYRLRTNQGQADPWSAVYWIDAEGSTTRVYAGDFEWIENKRWKSNRTGNHYPTEVTIRATHPDTGREMVYHLKPALASQEFIGNRPEDAYWEGACSVFDAQGQRIGRAYLELVGYDDSTVQQLAR